MNRKQKRTNEAVLRPMKLMLAFTGIILDATFGNQFFVSLNPHASVEPA
jgi:hypothetical protein